MPGKTDRKEAIKEVTQKIVYSAAVNIVNDEGYASVTMDKVAETAGVAKGTIYAYFKNKEELLREAFEDAVRHGHDDSGRREPRGYRPGGDRRPRRGNKHDQRH